MAENRSWRGESSPLFRARRFASFVFRADADNSSKMSPRLIEGRRQRKARFAATFLIDDGVLMAPLPRLYDHLLCAPMDPPPDFE